MFWTHSKSHKEIETQTDVFGARQFFSPIREVLIDAGEVYAQKALKEAQKSARQREFREMQRVRALELEMDNAFLRASASAIITNIRRQKQENQRSFNCTSNPRFFGTNWWKMPHGKGDL